ncbi:copper resistance D family protein [Gandjariella thermophila]|uniref:Copper resistance protein CopD n=1 Tax=Gandjariella thermophila TaxID=1931992 RepID=A0A4D4J7X6_9PSEU|nr:CopD family protein [Gandjariella thermophila]GDY31130.1 copper resistance protein CopD [Gandjariella thermophila]
MTRGAVRGRTARPWLVTGLVVAAVVGVLAGTAATAQPPVPGLVGPGPMIRYGVPVARVLLDLAALVTVGLSLLPKLLGFDRPAHTEPVLAVARPAAVVTSAVWVVAALAALVLQTAELHPGEPVTVGDVAGYVRRIGAGEGLVIVAACALAYLVVAVLAVRWGETVPAELRIVVAMFAVLPLPVTGHAANTGVNLHDLSMISMELHVMAAVAWTGGLAAAVTLLATNRGLLADVLPRFSRLATIALATVAVTGVFNGWFELYLTPGIHWYTALATTGYGRLVLVKVACLVTLAALGAIIRYRLLPRIVRHERTALAGWAATELAVMGLAFGIAVVLTRTPVIS